jgi:hypothetical protein
MYTAPDPAAPRTGNPPMGILPRPAQSGHRRLILNGRRLEFHTTPSTLVRWLGLDGKVLGRTRADTSGMAYWTVPGSYGGILLVEAEGGRQAVAVFLR